MDTEQFQSAKLGHLDFDADHQPSAQPIGHIPLPDELPKRADYSHLPKEILKSSTVENLISQNEDLMARLKVALRRLSLLENENQRLSEETNKARLSQSSITDQILVWREKDNMWKHKVDQIERAKEIQTEKLRALTDKVQAMNAELVRHQKYHDRIKNQVKPYITQLKEYSKTQDLKLQDLETSLNHKEALLRDLRHQIIEVTKNSRFQIETSEKKSQEMIQFYEDQIQSMSKELQVLHQAQEELEVKTLKLHTALERQDTLENELVVLRRSKEELRDRLEQEIHKQQERMSELSRQNQKLGVEHADLQIRVVEDQETIQKLEKENRQYFEQLESLRYMWTAKNEENEKLKAAASALERLNLELSQKLNEIRKQDGL
jgi:chromosome segregation ATPase